MHARYRGEQESKNNHEHSLVPQCCRENFVVCTVQVDVVTGRDLNPDPGNSVIFRAQSRDFMSFEYGCIPWTHALPLNELVVQELGKD